MSYGTEFRLTLFTNDLDTAARADMAGVDRIGLDLERIGKQTRQPSGKSWVSDHHESQLGPLYDLIEPRRRFVRTNPVHDDIEAELDRYVATGAQTLMLPMFRTVDEAKRFVDATAGRAKPVLLVETKDAAEAVPTLARIDGLAEFHVGLNDLHMDLGLGSHFELLTSRYMASLCDALRDTGLPYAFGGIGRALDESLPIPADLIYAQYPRLGATGALVSRVFHGTGGSGLDWPAEVGRARERLDDWFEASPRELEAARRRLADLTGH